MLLAALLLVPVAVIDTPKTLMGPYGPHTQDVRGQKVDFVTDVGETCTQQPATACMTFEDPPLIVLPNPCHPQWKDDGYALIACHELKHVNGMRHPDGVNQ